MTTPASIEQTAAPTASWWRTFTRQHWYIFSVASLAWLFDCFVQQVFNLSKDGAVGQLIADPTRTKEFVSYATSVFLVGWAIGGLIFGAFGDRYGRARVLAISIFIYSICTGLSALCNSYLAFCACVFLTGMGVGGVFGLAVALVADSVPDRSRAPALGMLQSLSSVGNLLACSIGMLLGFFAFKQMLPSFLKFWQAFFLVGSIPAFLFAFVLLRTKEPDKWIRAKAHGDKMGVKLGSYVTLMKNPTWRKHAWLGLVLCSAGIVGLWGIGNFSPTIVNSIIDAHLKTSDIPPTSFFSQKPFWTSLGLLLQNIGGFFGMLSMAKFAQIVGRRPAFALSLLLSLICSIFTLRYLRELNQIYWMLPLMGYGQFTVFGVYAIYLPELFPTSLRSTGTSFCYNFGRLVAATAPFTLGRLTKSLGGDIEGFRTAGMWISLVLLIGIVMLPFLPETKDRPLPE